MSLFIPCDAYERFRNPAEVASGWMLVVAVVGLVVNLVGARLLHEGSETSLNIKRASLELVSYMLISVGVIVAPVVAWATGWYYAGPLISGAIGQLILTRTRSLLTDTVNVLPERIPDGDDPQILRPALCGVPDVADVRDLHAWSLTTGVNALSVHVDLAQGSDCGSVLSAVHERITSGFHFAHATVQVEPAAAPVMRANPVPM